MEFVAIHGTHRVVITKGLRRLSCDCCSEDFWALEIDGESDDYSPFDYLSNAQDRAEAVLKAKLTWKED